MFSARQSIQIPLSTDQLWGSSNSIVVRSSCKDIHSASTGRLQEGKRKGSGGRREEGREGGRWRKEGREWKRGRRRERERELEEVERKEKSQEIADQI